MSVIIMHPKHNLERKYKTGGAAVCVRVWQAEWWGRAFPPQAQCKISDRDITRMYLLWESIHFAPSNNY